MNILDFFNKYDGVGCDYDGYYGDQCVDLVQFYNRDLLSAPVLTGNAKDIWNTYPQSFYDQISNTPDNSPQLGDVVIWNGNVGGGNGHISIAVAGNSNAFSSFDQNWPLNAFCHFQDHTYDNVIGWLRPKNLATSGNDQALLDQLRAERDKNWNLYQADEATIANLNNLTKAKDSQISTLTQQTQDLSSQLASKDMTITTLQDQANKIPQLTKERDQAVSDRDACLKAEDEQQAKIKDLQTKLDTGKQKNIILYILDYFK